ncbi:MAG: Trehalose synthase-like protein [Thermomicrobiales bacterium]|nr:Trehalose synthase-like protein [Thermomicrobiales bacterium]
MSPPSASQPEAAAVQSLLEEVCAGALPDWLEMRRWFADKGRGISGMAIEDVLVERVELDWLALTVARVEFVDGGAARYFLPLVLTDTPGDAHIITRAVSSAVSGDIVDATEKQWFGGWLLDQFAGVTELPPGAWDFAARPGAGAEIAAARSSPTTALRAEQSNSSLRFGDILIVKLFRRLQPGVNPDEEVLRALAGVRFERVPRYVGSICWRSPDDATYAIALAQQFVANTGDGWTWMLWRLAGVASGDVDPETEQFGAERLLGLRTGELHVALGAVQDPEFVSETTDYAAIDEDVRRTLAAIEETIQLLQERRRHLPEHLKGRLPEAIAGLRALADRADGYRDELNTRRIRVHGDYHLGQTLRTPDGDWVIIDFEGEPARSLAERRQRTSVLKDVAGMLRSFAYARGAAERAAEASPAAAREVKSRLDVWESGARRAFLDGYRQALAALATQFVPDDDEAFARALAGWELDKALYEVAYEARNRPDWLELPLRSLLPDLIDQAADSAGGAPA